MMIDVGTDNEKLLDNPQCKFLKLLNFFMPWLVVINSLRMIINMQISIDGFVLRSEEAIEVVLRSG